MERSVKEEVVVEISRGSEEYVPNVRSKPTGALSGLPMEGERRIDEQDPVEWRMTPGGADPVVRVSEGPPAGPATSFNTEEKLQAAHAAYFGEGSAGRRPTCV